MTRSRTDDRHVHAPGHRPGEVIDRGRELTFTWNGDEYPGFAGDTIASALAAGGVRVFSRSFKYHRPRGLLTASFLDPGCMVQVGDEPNVRGAHRLLEPGMVVSPQNAWPSLELRREGRQRARRPLPRRRLLLQDVHQAATAVARVQLVLSRFAAGGRVSARHRPQGYFDKRYAHPDVWWPAADRPGWRPRSPRPRPGRGCCWSRRSTSSAAICVGERGRAGCPGRAARGRSSAPPGIEVMTNSVVTGATTTTGSAVVQRDLGHVEDGSSRPGPRSLVVAPGLIERPYVFEGNDLPRGDALDGRAPAHQPLGGEARRPGGRPHRQRERDAAAEDLRRAGVDVAPRRRCPQRTTTSCGPRATARSYAPWSCADGERDRLRPARHGRRLDRADVAAQHGRRPSRSMTRRAARFFPASLPDNVLATGGIAGDGTLDELLAHARATGQEAARRAARIARRLSASIPQRAGRAGRVESSAVAIPELPSRDHPALFRARRTGWSTSPRTCRPRTSSPPPRRLRLRRAGQAVHDGHDGPGPGQARDGQRRRRAGRGHGADHRGDGHDGVAAPVRPDHPRRAGRAGLRARALLPHAALARGPRRAPARRRRLDPARPLRRPRRRGAQRADERRDHRRHARSASSTCAAPTFRSCSTCSTSTSGPSSTSAASATA